MGSDPLSSGSPPTVLTAFYAPTKNLHQIGGCAQATQSEVAVSNVRGGLGGVGWRGLHNLM